MLILLYEYMPLLFSLPMCQLISYTIERQLIYCVFNLCLTTGIKVHMVMHGCTMIYDLICTDETMDISGRV